MGNEIKLDILRQIGNINLNTQAKLLAGVQGTIRRFCIRNEEVWISGVFL